MKKLWNNTKAWIKDKWARFKKWAYSILVVLGLASGAVMAATVNFSWTMPTERTDGTPLSIDELVDTRVYCNGQTTPVLIMPAPATSASAVMGFGTHVCTATVTDIYNLESAQSNEVTKVIAPGAPPVPPILDQ